MPSLLATVPSPNCIICDGPASPPSRTGWLATPDRQALFACLRHVLRLRRRRARSEDRRQGQRRAAGPSDRRRMSNFELDAERVLAASILPVRVERPKNLPLDVEECGDRAVSCSTAMSTAAAARLRVTPARLHRAIRESPRLTRLGRGLPPTPSPSRTTNPGRPQARSRRRRRPDGRRSTMTSTRSRSAALQLLVPAQPPLPAPAREQAQPPLPAPKQAEPPRPSWPAHAAPAHPTGRWQTDDHETHSCRTSRQPPSGDASRCGCTQPS